jgi:tRNA(Arg) A34 adenosine deaminase TadA
MCLSALAWSGFREVYFLFGYNETKDDFDIPDDIRMLKEIFRCEKPSRKSSYLEMWSIPEILEEMADPASYLRKIEDLKQHYLRLSEQYFSQKNLKGM